MTTTEKATAVRDWIVRACPGISEWWCVDCDCLATDPSAHDHDRETSSLVKIVPDPTLATVLRTFPMLSAWMGGGDRGDDGLWLGTRVPSMDEDMEDWDCEAYLWRHGHDSLDWHIENAPEVIDFLFSFIPNRQEPLHEQPGTL